MPTGYAAWEGFRAETQCNRGPQGAKPPFRGLEASSHWKEKPSGGPTGFQLRWVLPRAQSHPLREVRTADGGGTPGQTSHLPLRVISIGLCLPAMLDSTNSKQKEFPRVLMQRNKGGTAKSSVHLTPQVELGEEKVLKNSYIKEGTI